MSDGCGCFDGFVRCCGLVPVSATMVCVTLIGVTGACAAALLVAVRRTRDLLDYNSDYLDYADPVCIGVLCGTAVVALFCLVVCTLCTKPTCGRLFSTTRMNRCGRALNVLTMMLVVLLIAGWTAAVSVLALPVIYLVLLHILYKDRKVECIDLANYGLYEESKEICNATLDRFYDESQDVLLCYSIAVCSSVLVVIFWVLFLLCLMANMAHLREARLVNYSVYRNDIATSKNSVLDTRM